MNTHRHDWLVTQYRGDEEHSGLRAFTIGICWALLAVSAARAQVPSFPSEEKLKGKKAGELVTKLGKYGATDADWGFLFVPENRTRAGK
ncbi:MAG: hypothetical protein ACKVS6_04105 [Planctomycetota bacterium]